jgi:hypothetical protein
MSIKMYNYFPLNFSKRAILSEKFTVAQAVMKFPESHGTRKLLTVKSAPLDFLEYQKNPVHNLALGFLMVHSNHLA